MITMMLTCTRSNRFGLPQRDREGCDQKRWVVGLTTGKGRV